MFRKILPVITALAIGMSFVACSDSDADEPYVLQRDDVKVDVPEGGFSVAVDQLLKIEVAGVNDPSLRYSWTLDGEPVNGGKVFNHMFSKAGDYSLELTVSQGEISFAYPFNVRVYVDGNINNPSDATAYITKVFDFLPAPGQFVNTLPAYAEGDTQESMNAKVLEAIGNNKKGSISLGAWGGYVVVGFDHTIENKPGLRDFRVLGNSFYNQSSSDPEGAVGNSCEPGIIAVAYDSNGNGMPDDDEWYVIEGSGQADPTQEAWYGMAVAAGLDVNLYTDYEMTYYRPESKPTTAEEKKNYVKWDDNKGNSGYFSQNAFHTQSYFPMWVKPDKLTFKGVRLPQNGIDKSGAGSNYVLYKFRYGYADNDKNAADGSAIDIDWAVNDKGQKVSLPGVDFIKIYTGVNQSNGWIGENSTEVMGVEDLHLLGVSIPAF